MVVEPGIEVNAVEDQTAPQLEVGHVQLRQQRDPDAQVDGGLLLGQTARRRQRQVGLVHHSPCLAR